MRRAWKVWMRVMRRVRPEITVRVAGKRLRIDLRDRTIARRLYWGKEWEPELQHLMRTMDLRGSVCLDVGANIGVHTLVMSDLVGPSGRVYAFEPEPRNFSLLGQNLTVNGMTNVTALCTAVSDVVGTARLWANPVNYGDHRVSPRARGAFHEVPMTTVDEVLSSVPNAAVRFIKIDVQGYEHHVLRGMQATLERNPDAILAIEVFPEALRGAGTSARKLMECLAHLRMIGWEFFPRLLPLQEPWVYDLIGDGQEVDVLASGNGELLRTVLSSWQGRPLTPA